MRPKTKNIFGCFFAVLSLGWSAEIACAGSNQSSQRSGKPVSGAQLKPQMAPVAEDGDTVRLKGGTTVYQQRDPNLEAWRAAQLYQQGAYALSLNDLRTASECFRQSGDAFELSVGEGKFLAESRFAEAQSRRLMGQIPQAAKLFQVSVDIFRRADPYNPYLQAGIQTLRLMGYADKQVKPPPKKKAPLQLQAIQPKMASIDRVLEASLTKLDDGTLIASLHDTDFFDGSRKRLPQVASCDLSEQFLKTATYKAFLEMTCLEFGALGANYLTVNANYKPFLANDKPVVVGASEDIWESPTAKISINGKSYSVSMTLPGISKYSRNVYLLTDGQHVLAIDPRKNDIWKLVPVLSDKGASEFNWWKLTHTKEKTFNPVRKKEAGSFSRKSAD